MEILNLQISQDVNQVLQFCGFYLKAWEGLGEKHTNDLNLNLPKEKLSNQHTRARPSIDKTLSEIYKLQKTQSDAQLMQI